MTDPKMVALGVTNSILNVGIGVTSYIADYYTPHARGVRTAAFVCPADEFMGVSAVATQYVNLLSKNPWVGVRKWLKFFHKTSRETFILNLHSLREYEVVAKHIGMEDMMQWMIPTFQISDGDRLVFREVSAIEYVKMHDIPWNDFPKHLIQIVLFGFPIYEDFLFKLQVNHIIGPYIRARLFQGIADIKQAMKESSSTSYISSFLPKKYQHMRPDFSIDSYVNASNLDANTSIVNTHIIGAKDVPALYGLMRSKLFGVCQKPGIFEYKKYVQTCEQKGLVPVGYKVYNEIVHPLKSSQAYQSFVQYSF